MVYILLFTIITSQLKPKKDMCVSDRPTDSEILQPTLTFCMPEKKIDRQIRKFVSVSVFVSDFNNRRLTVAILTLSDKRLTETDLLKTGFLFEVSSFPCTFDRCLEPNTLYCMPNN
jgi:hypothetical protein